MIDTLTLDDYAYITNALEDRMYDYPKNSQGYKTCERISEEILEELKDKHHVYTNKLEYKLVMAQCGIEVNL